MKKEYKAFMLESNRIEGENRINPGDEKAIKHAIQGIDSLAHILEIHETLGKYLNKPWVGQLRMTQVYVGDYMCPPPSQVNELMNSYIWDFIKMDSWTAHNEFQKIHPFQDLNGRVGRLIWLSKAVKEGYIFTIPFLQYYYYQTLGRYKK